MGQHDPGRVRWPASTRASCSCAWAATRRTTAERYRTARGALLRLLDPAAMGRFAVLGFGRGMAAEPPLRGFDFRLCAAADARCASEAAPLAAGAPAPPPAAAAGGAPAGLAARSRGATRHEPGPPGFGPTRESAVLVLVFPDATGEARLVLTERPATVTAPCRRGQLPGRRARGDGDRLAGGDGPARGGRGGRASTPRPPVSDAWGAWTRSPSRPSGFRAHRPSSRSPTREPPLRRDAARGGRHPDPAAGVLPARRAACTGRARA